MNKGILLMIAAGIGFMYMVTNFVSQAESTTPGLADKQTLKEKEYAQFYEKDINGDDVLNFSGAPLSKAIEVWNASTVKMRTLSYFPDFDNMRQIVESQLQDSAFKEYLLSYCKRVERKYLDGTMSLDQAKAACSRIK